VSLTLTSSVYICQVTTFINYQPQTFTYQQLVDKKMVLSTVGVYQKLLVEKLSIKIRDLEM
jgi:hypothetical protein